MRWPNFCGGQYISQSYVAANELLMNFYPEKIETPAGTTQNALYPTPGVNRLVPEFESPLQGPGRAHFEQSGREFCVEGGVFAEVNSVGLMTTYGVVTSDSNPATLSGNGPAGHQIFITSGGNGYLFDTSTNTFSTIAALAGIATMGDFLGGYFLCLDAATAIVRISDLFDGTTWDPTQFFQRSGGSDGWISMKVNQYVYLFGSESSEVWFNSGAFPIPFELHPSGRLQYGIAAPYSAEVVGASMIWLGSTANGHGGVLRTSGFAVEVISDYSTHYAFDNFPTLADAIGDSYEEFGHVFYILTFPTADETWAYDTSMNEWAKRGTWDSDRNVFQAWRPMFHAFAFGQHRMLDLRGNRIYQMSSNFGYDVDDLPIRRVRRPPVLMNENKRIFYKRTELLIETGLALNGDVQGSDPVVMMRWSDDGGKNWSNELEASAGERGDYDARVYWAGCGSGRKRTTEFIFTDPVPWRVIDCFVEAEQGTN